MAQGKVTRRQKDISRLIKERGRSAKERARQERGKRPVKPERP
ncbi:MAG TPA: hypothetical protein PLS81_04615 [Deltaproteobacteria bacterium]|nr:hypothetical protein [Deltaproteobacteria bacterium]HOM28721.1 hypothetical protein [Deltaproteobacteria bacterium]HPP81589.1 hypothetical protein [Deltaproteobacteria bacterium]